MYHILDKVQPQKGKSCIFSALAVLFQQFGYSETDLFFLTDELNIKYRINDYDPQNPEHSYLGQLYLSTKDILEVISRRLCKMHIFENNNSDNLHTEIAKAFSVGSPIFLHLDTGKLTYHNIYKENEGRQHCIIIYGIDRPNDKYFIIDSHIRDYCSDIHVYKGPIPQDEVKSSFNLYAWIDTKKCLAIDKRAIVNNMLENINTFTRGGQLDDEIYTGINALRKYIGDLVMLKNTPEDTFLRVCQDIHLCMRIWSMASIIDYTMDLIIENPEFRGDDFDVLLSNLRKLHDGWYSLSLSILKAGISNKKQDINRIVAHAYDLIGVLEERFNDILTVFQSI